MFSPRFAINNVVNEWFHVEQHTKSSECSAQKRSEALLNCNAEHMGAMVLLPSAANGRLSRFQL
jgi:hypothetical protein